jgi:hypothetical protein
MNVKINYVAESHSFVVVSRIVQYATLAFTSPSVNPTSRYAEKSGTPFTLQPFLFNIFVWRAMHFSRRKYANK